MTQQNSHYILYNGLTVTLCLLTFVLFEKIDHYLVISDELLKNHSFDEGLTDWSTSWNVDRDQNQVIDLSNWSPAEGHFIHQSLHTPASGFVRLSADIQIINVKAGPAQWQTARVDILGLGADKKWHWEFPNTLIKGSGTQKFINVTRDISIPKDFSEIRIESGLTGGTGVFLIERLSLVEIEPKSIVKLMTYAVLSCWLTLGLVVLFSLVRRKMWLPCLVTIVATLLLLVIPESLKLTLLDVLKYWVPHSKGIPVEHLILFFPAALLLCFISKYTPAMRLAPTMLSLVTFSIASEVLQYYTAHRNPTLIDGITNVTSISLALMFFLTFQKATDCWTSRDNQKIVLGRHQNDIEPSLVE